MADVTGAPGTDARREQAQLVERVEAHIDQLFERLAMEWGLTRGDLSPLQSLRLAPSAIRTPSSLVRCATEQAMTPYNPMAARISARPANAPSSVVRKRGWASEPSTRASMVWIMLTVV